MTFGIDKKGDAFYRVDVQPIRYETTEDVKDDSGHVIGHRTVTKEIEQKPIDKTPQECGWEKIVTWETVVLMILPNPKNHYKPEARLFYQKCKIDVDRYAAHNSCSFCTNKEYGSKYHYFRAMPNGVFHICWCCATRYGRSSSGPIQTHLDVHSGSLASWVKVIEEKPISRMEAIAFFNRSGSKPSVDVALFLEGSEFT